MGLLATAFIVTYMVTAPIFGWMADRVKRWTIIGVGVILWSVATGVCGLATSFWMLLVCRVFVGVGEAAWGPTAPTVISDLYPVSKRGAVLAWFNVALSVGSAAGFVLGGQIAHRWGWKWAFIGLAPPGLVLGTWALFFRDPPRGRFEQQALASATPTPGYSAPAPKDRSSFLAKLFGALREIVRIRSYAFNTAGMAAMTFGVGGMAYWMVTYVHEFRMNGEVVTEAGSAAHAQVTLIFGGLVVVTGLGGTLVGGYLADWLHKRMKGGGAYFLLSGVTMLAAFPFFLAMLYSPFPAAWVVMGVSIFLIFMGTGPTNTIIANVTPPRMRGSAFALNILIIHLFGDAISPTVIGLVSDATHSMNAGFAVVGVAMVLAGVFWLLGARHLKEDTEMAPAR